MTCSVLSKKTVVLAALIVMTIASYPVRGQEKNTEKPKSESVPSDLLDTERIRTDYLNVYSNNLAAIDFTNQAILALQGPSDNLLGATLQPVGDTLRTQLGIPVGQGLVVETLRGDGACALVGLQRNDVLLTLSDKPLATTDDLNKQLKQAGDSAVLLKVLRTGKPLTIQVRPIYRVTLGPVAEQKTEFFIGVSVVGPNDAVRAQLGLPDSQGVVVNEVEKGSAAEKAGVKKYDILLELNGKPIDSPETLSHLVQSAKDQPATLKILHHGNQVTLTITPIARKVEATVNLDTTYRLFLNRSHYPIAEFVSPAHVENGVRWLSTLQKVKNPTASAPLENGDVRKQLERLEKELNEVRATLDKINETLKAKK